MSEKDVIWGILADKPVAYRPDLARIGGSVKAGIFLSQLLYWSGKEKRCDGFIWKTQEDWENETALTRREQETARKQLKSLGILEEKLYGVPATLHYKINFDQLYKLLDAHYRQSSMAESAKLDCTNQPNKDARNVQSIPESTQESTIDDDGDDPLSDLVELFAKKSFCRIPRNGRYQSDWLDPLVTIYRASGEHYETTVKRIEVSIEMLKEGGYKVVSPASIQNTAVNITNIQPPAKPREKQKIEVILENGNTEWMEY